MMNPAELRITLVRPGDKSVQFFRPNELGAGYENIAYALRCGWLNTEDALRRDFDVVLTPGTHASIISIVDRCPRWRKVVMIEEAGISVANTGWYSAAVARFKPDAIMVHTPELAPFYASLGAPILQFSTPLSLDARPDLRTLPKDPDRINVNLLRYADPAANLLGTITAARLLHHEDPRARFVAYVPEVKVPEFLRDLTSAAGLADVWEWRPATCWESYLPAAARCGRWFSLDGRRSFGRFQAEAAMCGVLCVGPASTPMQTLLFRAWAVDDEANVSVAVKALRAARDQPFWVSQQPVDHETFGRWLRQRLVEELRL